MLSLLQKSLGRPAQPVALGLALTQRVIIRSRGIILGSGAPEVDPRPARAVGRPDAVGPDAVGVVFGDDGGAGDGVELAVGLIRLDASTDVGQRDGDLLRGRSSGRRIVIGRGQGAVGTGLRLAAEAAGEVVGARADHRLRLSVADHLLRDAILGVVSEECRQAADGADALPGGGDDAAVIVVGIAGFDAGGVLFPILVLAVELGGILRAIAVGHSGELVGKSVAVIDEGHERPG